MNTKKPIKKSLARIMIILVFIFSVLSGVRFVSKFVVSKGKIALEAIEESPGLKRIKNAAEDILPNISNFQDTEKLKAYKKWQKSENINPNRAGKSYPSNEIDKKRKAVAHARPIGIGPGIGLL